MKRFLLINERIKHDSETRLCVENYAGTKTVKFVIQAKITL